MNNLLKGVLSATVAMLTFCSVYADGAPTSKELKAYKNKKKPVKSKKVVQNKKRKLKQINNVVGFSNVSEPEFLGNENEFDHLVSFTDVEEPSFQSPLKNSDSLVAFSDVTEPNYVPETFFGGGEGGSIPPVLGLIGLTPIPFMGGGGGGGTNTFTPPTGGGEIPGDDFPEEGTPGGGVTPGGGNPVPEPSSILAVGTGLLALLRKRFSLNRS